MTQLELLTNHPIAYLIAARLILGGPTGSTRSLASQLGVPASRVQRALSLLKAFGMLESREGALVSTDKLRYTFGTKPIQQPPIQFSDLHRLSGTPSFLLKQDRYSGDTPREARVPDDDKDVRWILDSYVEKKPGGNLTEAYAAVKELIADGWSPSRLRHCVIGYFKQNKDTEPKYLKTATNFFQKGVFEQYEYSGRPKEVRIQEPEEVATLRALRSAGQSAQRKV